MAFGNATFSDIGTAVSDIFAAKGDELKAKGAAFEQQSYQQAAALATQNEQFTEMSTAIKQSQADRNLYQALGTTRADVAGAGFAQSGSALDILRESASQGAMTKAVLGEQGLITEAGYQEQAQSYTDMERRRRCYPGRSGSREGCENRRLDQRRCRGSQCRWGYCDLGCRT